MPSDRAFETRTIVVWSGKGGVGKSTVAKAISRGLQAQCIRTGHFDADLTGPSAPALFGVDGRLRVASQRIQPAISAGIPVVSTGLLADADRPFIWHGPLLRGAMHQLLHDTDWGPLDVLVVDLPPGTGEPQLAVLAELNVVGAVIVTTPHELALLDVRRSLRMLDEASVPVLAIVENLAEAVCPSCACSWSPFPGTAGKTLHALRPGARLIRLPIDSQAPEIDARGNADASLIRHLAEAGLFSDLHELLLAP